MFKCTVLLWMVMGTSPSLTSKVFAVFKDRKFQVGLLAGIGLGIGLDRLLKFKKLDD